MQNGICPKCQSHEVHIQTIKLQGQASFVNAFPILWDIFRGVVSTPLNTYLCISCGYVESYVADKDKLKELANILPKVEGNDRKI